MSFLKDLVLWFIRGQINSDSDPSAAALIPRTISIRPEPVAAATKKERKPKELERNGHERAYDILQELKSIEPVSKGFEKAREEMLQELKRLAPRRRVAK